MYELKEYLSRGSIDISRTLNTRYSTPDKAHATLNEMLAQGGHIVALKSLRSNLMDCLRTNMTGNIQFFRIPTRLSDEEKGHRIALFKEFNIILGEEYKKAQQFKETRGKNTIKVGGKSVSYSGDRQIVLYNSNRGNENPNLFGSRSGWRSGSHKYSTIINDVNENAHKNMVRIGAKQFDSMVGIMNRLSCDWKMMHDMKGLGDDVMKFDTLMNNVGKKYYQTNNGKVKGSDLKGEYNVIVMEDQTLLDTIDIGELDTVLAVKNVDEYIALLWYNEVHDDKLGLDNDIYGETFTNITKCHVKFNDTRYDSNKGTKIARLYWIEKLLPDIYAEIFTNAIQYNPDSIDKIEKVARELNEVLKQ
jgi:hypothetical protein